MKTLPAIMAFFLVLNFAVPCASCRADSGTETRGPAFGWVRAWAVPDPVQPSGTAPSLLHGALRVPVVMDSEGSLYVACNTVRKYSPSGDLLRETDLAPLYSDGSPSIVAIAADSSGDIYAAGAVTMATLIPSTRPGAPLCNKTEAILVKLDRDGKILWSKRWSGEPDSSSVWANVFVDKNDNPIIVGSYLGDILPDPDASAIQSMHTDWTSPPPPDFPDRSMMAKLDPSGRYVWSVAWTGTIFSCARDTDGHVFVFTRTMNIKLPRCTFGPDIEQFRVAAIVEFDSDGLPVWTYFGSGSFEGLFNGDICVDGSGNIYLGMAGTEQFGGTTPQGVCVDGERGFQLIEKDNPVGNFVYSFRSVTTDTGQVVACIACDESGDLYVAGDLISGSSHPEFDLDPTHGTDKRPQAGQGFFVSKLKPDGTYAWGMSIDGLRLDGVTSIATSNGDIYLAGIFASKVDFDPSEGSATEEPSGAQGLFVVKYSESVP